MGVCAIGILICHVTQIVQLSGLLRFIVSLGNYGVEGFMFLSGIGLHQSLLKKNYSLTRWYARRLERVFSPYLILAIPYWAFFSFLHHQGALEFLKGVFFITFYTEHKGFWFVAAILPIYFMAPMYVYLYEKCKEMHLKLMFTALITGTLLMFSITENNAPRELLWNIRWCCGKIAPFFVGVFFLDLILIGKRVNIMVHTLTSIILFGILTILPVTRNISWWWILVYPAFIFICCLVDQAKWIGLKTFLDFMGSISLESYMVNGVLIESFKCLRTCFPALQGNGAGIIVYVGIIVILGTLLCIPYSKLTQRMRAIS